MKKEKKVMLIILDGYGEGKHYKGNSVTLTKNNYVDELKNNYPWTLLKTDSEAVGLPPNTMGGSEVGHFTMGCGRVVFQMLEMINRSIKDGSFFKKEEFLEVINHAKRNNSKLHLIGMISDAGVHSHLNHLYALLHLAKNEGLSKDQVYIHAITDGRDVPEKSAQKFLKQILEKIDEIGIGKIATICGRFFTMDRDQNWNRTSEAYYLLTEGKGHQSESPLQAITEAYARGDKTDYYIEPILLDRLGLIEMNDAIINFNYRSDRAAQITRCFVDPSFSEFKTPFKTKYICFGPYSKIAPIAFLPPEVKHNLGETLSKENYRQLRMAETEKFPHVTFFFNSQVKEPYPGEHRISVDSPKVASYDEKPEMSARELTRAFVEEIEKDDNYKLVVLNFANPDLVGHSGKLEATIEAVETVHECLEEMVNKAKEKGYDILITADHGNAEYMIDEITGEPFPSHTLNKVIFILLSEEHKNKTLEKEGVGLKEVAPTILDLLDIKKPQEMEGKSLIKN